MSSSYPIASLTKMMVALLAVEDVPRRQVSLGGPGAVDARDGRRSPQAPRIVPRS